MRVCLAGTFEPGFSRNRKLTRLLTLAGHQIDTVRQDLWGDDRVAVALSVGPSLVVRAIVAQARLLVRLLRAPAPDVYLVAHPGWFDMPVVRLAGWIRRRPVVLDYFIGLHETVVEDRRLVGPGMPVARLLQWVDRVALRLADLVLVDTPARADRLGIRRAPVTVVWVGASDPMFVPDDRPPEPNLVLFYGTYVPLQGAEVIAASARLLEGDGVRFRLIGDGQDSERVRAAVAGATNVELVGTVPLDRLVEELRGATICLGIFGTSEKARLVVPHKVFDAVAVGRPVISAETLALRQAFASAEVMGCTAGDPRSLAEAIRRLLADPGERERLGAAGLARYRRDYTDEALAALLDKALGRVARC